MAQQIQNALQTLHNLAHGNMLPSESQAVTSIVQNMGMNPQEVYHVAEKFDIHPAELTEKERKLRIKYLEILKKIIDNNIISAGKLYNIADPTNGDAIYVKKLVDRMIVLFINEAKDVGSIKKYAINYGTFFLILLCIALLGYILMTMKDGNRSCAKISRK